MVVNFKVFKKCAPNGKMTLYMGKRDFVDHISGVEPIGMFDAVCFRPTTNPAVRANLVNSSR